jgi:hypothetical protein
MRSTVARCAILAGALVSLTAVSVALLARADKPAKAEAVRPSKYKPTWQVGQQWLLETTHAPTQARHDGKGSQPSTVRWRFTVQGKEKIGGHDCFKVEAQCLAGGKAQPVAALWADARSMALRQVQVRLPVQGQFRTITESYQGAKGQAAAVLTPLTALPLDLPVFAEDKSAQRFGYEVISGPGGVKALGDIGFAIEVEQKTVAPEPASVKALLADDFRKDLEARPVLKVELRAPGRKVVQLWQEGRPWPVYSDNGAVQARLLEVVSPKR